MKVICSDCKGTGIIDPCPHCKGEGKIEHDCIGNRSLALVFDIYGCDDRNSGSIDSLGVYRCKTCNQLWKIRFQYDAGTGSDNIWMRSGESARHFSFPEIEAKTVAQILNAKSIAELPEGLTNDSGYIRRFTEKRAEELRA